MKGILKATLVALLIVLLGTIVTLVSLWLCRLVSPWLVAGIGFICLVAYMYEIMK